MSISGQQCLTTRSSDITTPRQLSADLYILCPCCSEPSSFVFVSFRHSSIVFDYRLRVDWSAAELPRTSCCVNQQPECQRRGDWIKTLSSWQKPGVAVIFPVIVNLECVGVCRNMCKLSVIAVNSHFGAEPTWASLPISGFVKRAWKFGEWFKVAVFCYPFSALALAVCSVFLFLLCLCLFVSVSLCVCFSSF